MVTDAPRFAKFSTFSARTHLVSIFIKACNEHLSHCRCLASISTVQSKVGCATKASVRDKGPFVLNTWPVFVGRVVCGIKYFMLMLSVASNKWPFGRLIATYTQNVGNRAWCLGSRPIQIFGLSMTSADWHYTFISC